MTGRDAFVEAAKRATQCAVILYLFEGTGGLDIASGVLVLVAGRHFVFTAGHNLADCRDKNDILLHFPGYEPVLQARSGGGHSIIRYEHQADPDVAVIELDATDATLWARREAIPIEALATPTEIALSDHLLLVGFAAADTVVAEGPRTDRKDVAVAAHGRAIGAVLEPARSPHEPAAGRGVHVRLHGDWIDSTTGEPTTLPAPEGISGGPLVAVSESGVKLLGLARSVHGEAEHYEWCEPAYEAVRLLLRHEDKGVRTEAEALLRRVGP